MRARLLLRERRVLGQDRFADIVIWQLPAVGPGSSHEFKYRLAFVVDGVCVLRFDNEAGKGDHKHLGSRQVPYAFKGVAQLVADFWDEIEAWSAR
jgi:hypothetical protein